MDVHIPLGNVDRPVRAADQVINADEQLMAWWTRLFRKKAEPSLEGQQFQVAFRLYSEDGSREVEVCEFENGKAYLVERELDGRGTFVDRHSGSMVGPFKSPKAAENFIIKTAWFEGRDRK